MQTTNDTLLRSIPAQEEGVISRSVFFIVLLVVCVAVWFVLVDMPQKTEVKNVTPEPEKLQPIIEQREKALWESFKNKDKEAFADLLADEYTGVFVDGQGEHDKQSAVDSLNQVTINRYSLSDFKLSPLGADTVLLRYNASGKFSGVQEQDVKLAVGNIWVKRGGQWQSLRYQVTATN
jgi:hypothetical protein